MLNLKVGDRVTLKESSPYPKSSANPINISGTIYYIDKDNIQVKWENGYSNSYILSDLDLIESGKQYYCSIEDL